MEETALIKAASLPNRLHLIELLIRAGAAIDRPALDGRTPLFRAVAAGNLGVASCLVRAGADPNKADNAGLTPLSWAVAEEDIDLVRCLVERSAPNTLSAGRTMLFGALDRGHLATVRALAEAGVELESESLGFTPLTLAASKVDSVEKVRCLMDAGACIDGNANSNPLVEAAAEGHLEVLRMLIGAGANLEKCPAQKKGHTPVVAAASRGQVALFLCLSLIVYVWLRVCVRKDPGLSLLKYVLSAEQML